MIELLKTWQDRYQECEKLIDALTPITGGSPENDVFKVIWGTFGDYTAALSIVVGDDAEWLEWFAYENDMGKKKHEAGPVGKMRKIETLQDLLWLLK